jgi:hypothetical protein
MSRLGEKNVCCHDKKKYMSFRAGDGTHTKEDERNAAEALLELYYLADYVAKSVTVEGYQHGEPIITVEWHPTWEPLQHVPRNFGGQILDQHEDLILVQWPPNAKVRTQWHFTA